MKKFIDTQFEIRSVTDNGEFAGYGSVFGNVDHHRSVIEHGAFTKTLDKHKAKGTMPAMLWHHDLHEPIGKYREIREDNYGLYVEGQILVDAGPTEKRAYEHVKAGTITGLSIGFMIPEGGESFDSKARVTRINEVDLFEISVVSVPANEQAQIQTVRSIFGEGGLPAPKEVERLLRDAGFSRQQAKAFIAEGYKGLGTRDATTSLGDLLAARQLQQSIREVTGVSL